MKEIMKEILIYTIVYYEKGKFFMTSSNAFLTFNAAENCAKNFCDKHKNSKYTYEIEQLYMLFPVRLDI